MTLISAKNVIINLPTWITVTGGRRKYHARTKKLLNTVDDEYETKRLITDSKHIYAYVFEGLLPNGVETKFLTMYI